MRWLVVLLLSGALCCLLGAAPAPPSTAPGTAPVVAAGDGDPVMQTVISLVSEPPKTGDALWDEYSQDLLEALGVMLLVKPEDRKDMLDFIQDGTEASGDLPYLQAKPELPPRVPDSVLAALEQQFGQDPRYWQLRYWNAWQYNDHSEQGDADPLRFLREGAKRGAEDAATAWLLLEDDLQHPPAEDAKLLGGPASDHPTQAEALANAQALEREHRRQMLLLDDFVAKYPAESLGWYVRAQQKEDYGDTQGCLGDLRSGNAAANNRVPLPFPLSFVSERTAAGQPVGSEVVAGVVTEAAGNRSTIRGALDAGHLDHDLQVAFDIGGTLDMTQPVFEYGCRLATMRGATHLWHYAGLAIAQTQADRLASHPPASADQTAQQALARLEHRLASLHLKLKGLSAPPGLTDIAGFEELVTRETARRLAEQGITDEQRTVAELGLPGSVMPNMASSDVQRNGDSPELRMGQLELGARGEAVRTLARLDFYSAIYAWNVQQNGPAVEKKLEGMDKIARFDFATLSWPADDTADE
jgi:hypothetical protein